MIGKACAHPGCPAVIKRGQRCCARHSLAVEQRRGSSSARGYDARWREATKSYRRANPLCVECNAQGVTTAVYAVDHIKPHKGQSDPMFWDERNWQSLCHRHHSIKTARDDGGFGRSTSPAGASVAGAGRDTHTGAAPQGAGRSLGTARL